MSAYNHHPHHQQTPSSSQRQPSESHTTSSSQDMDKSLDPLGSGSRRPRGRPAGSKNKPQPPVIVTRDTPNSLRSHMLEISSGADIMESLATYASRRGKGISIISGNGRVADVSLKHATETNSIVTLNGRFEILSLSGTILPPPAPPGASGLSIFLSGGQGQVMGGAVVGPLLAAGPVMLIAALFSNAVYERLPLEPEEDQEVHQQMHGPGGEEGDAGGGPSYGYPYAGGGGGGGDHGMLGWGGNAPRPPF